MICMFIFCNWKKGDFSCLRTSEDNRNFFIKWDPLFNDKCTILISKLDGSLYILFRLDFQLPFSVITTSTRLNDNWKRCLIKSSFTFVCIMDDGKIRNGESRFFNNSLFFLPILRHFQGIGTLWWFSLFFYVSCSMYIDIF